MKYGIDEAEYKYEMGKVLFETIRDLTEVSEKSLKYISILLSKGINIDYKDPETGYTSLMLVIERDYEKVYNLLIPFSPVTSITNHLGINATHLAASSKNPNYLIDLCNRGVDIDAPDKAGNRPINYAIKAKRIANIKELRERGCTLNYLNVYGHSIYDEAELTNDEQVISCVHSNMSTKKRNLVERILHNIETSVKKKF